MIGQTISHYKILSRLGAGGMGVVYEAEDTRLGRKVAIKFLPDEANADADAIQRFQREARVISNLNHPYICTLYDIGTHEGRQFMVMELLDGQLLKDRISKGTLAVEEVVELGAQMADALDAAHSQGVVHRDIKPANLFVTRRGTIKVLDFGVAKLGEAGRTDPGATIAGTDQLTTMGTTIGTIAYMSPEQARGQEIDPRSDLFSAGAVLYEMACGQLPFQGTTPATIFEGLLTKAPVPPSQINADVPAELNRIVLKALEKDRETRYQGAAELRADLKRLKRSSESGMIAAQSASSTRARVQDQREPSPKAGSQSRWKVPVLVGAPVVTIALIAGFMLYRQTATPALTQQDSVVLSAMVNRTGDTMFDDTLGEALALQLRQSPFLNLVPEQQVQATLRLMGREPSTAVTAEIGREVCQRSGAKALLGGTIAMLGSSYVLTLNAQDCVEGKVFAEEQVQAPSKESVLGVMGTAVSAFREKLGESLASIQRYDTKIEEATTGSLEALKAYSQALRTRRTSGDFDSVPFFRRAIELDPNFALAYARLGTVYYNLRQTEEGRANTRRAFELREKVSEGERLYIEARYYTEVENNAQKAIDAYNVWLATYPNEYTALTNVALLYKRLGNREEALRKLELATKVAPDQPLGWTNLGQTYLEASQFTEARRVYETAVKLQDSTSARVGLYESAIMLGDMALAEQQVAAVRGRRDEVDMIGIRMFAALYRGRMKEAAELATEYQARSVALSRGPSAGPRIMTVAINEAIMGLVDEAKARVAALERDGLTNEQTFDDQLVIAALTEDAAWARDVLPRAVAEQKASGPASDGGVDGAKLVNAIALLAERRPAEAAAMMEPISFRIGLHDLISIWSIAKMRAGDAASALKGFTFLVSPEAHNGLNTSYAYSHAMLGRLYAQLGQPGEARKHYQRLFELFKDADPDLPMLMQAREEFAKLGS
ncbi:MAG TPA: serine/threonine-protein kinase [Vicinamibacterales bacterium]|nr:serine/threonine-protein kinase [Vicinamibacterales bacterium]